MPKQCLLRLKTRLLKAQNNTYFGEKTYVLSLKRTGKIAHFDTHTIKGPNNQEVMLARVFWQYLQTKDFIFEITQFRSVIKIQYVSKTHITAAI